MHGLDYDQWADPIWMPHMRSICPSTACTIVGEAQQPGWGSNPMLMLRWRQSLRQHGVHSGGASGPHYSSSVTTTASSSPLLPLLPLPVPVASGSRFRFSPATAADEGAGAAADDDDDEEEDEEEEGVDLRVAAIARTAACRAGLLPPPLALAGAA